MESENNKEFNRHLKAKKRVEEIKSFYMNLVAYCVVIPFLAFINYQSNWHYKWFLWPMFGWGIGIIIQAFITFGYGKEWEERKIKEYMNNDKF